MGSTEKRLVIIFCVVILGYGGYLSYKHSQEPKKVQTIANVANPPAKPAVPPSKNIMPKSEEEKILKELDDLEKEHNAGMKKITDEAEAKDKILRDMLAGRHPSAAKALNVNNESLQAKTVKQFFRLFGSKDTKTIIELPKISWNYGEHDDFLINMYASIVSFKNVTVLDEQRMTDRVWFVNVEFRMTSIESTFATLLYHEMMRVFAEEEPDTKIPDFNQIIPPSKINLEKFETVVVKIPVFCPNDQMCLVDVCVKSNAICQANPNVIGYALGSGHVISKQVGNAKYLALKNKKGKDGSALRLEHWLNRAMANLQIPREKLNSIVARSTEIVEDLERSGPIDQTPTIGI